MSGETGQGSNNQQVTMHEHMQGRKVMIGVPVAAIALASVAYFVVEGNVSDSSVHHSQAGTSDSRITIDGRDVIKDGSDKQIGSEDAAGRYNCGGLKGKEIANNEFTAESIVNQMTANPELAKADKSFFENVFGNKGFKKVVSVSLENSRTKNSGKLADNDYAQFLHNLMAAPVADGIILQNHACVDENHDGKRDGIKIYDYRRTHNTTMTGLVMTAENWSEVQQTAHEEGRNPENELVVELIHVTDEQGVAKEMTFVGVKHKHCANNELKVTVTPKPTPTHNSPTPRVTPTSLPSHSPRPSVPPKHDDGRLPQVPGAAPAEQDPGTPGKPGKGPAGQPVSPIGTVPGEVLPTQAPYSPAPRPQPTSNPQPTGNPETGAPLPLTTPEPVVTVSPQATATMPPQPN